MMTAWLICLKHCHLSYQVTNYSWVRFSPSSWLALFIMWQCQDSAQLTTNYSGYFEEFSLLNVSTKGIGPLTTLRHWSCKLSRMSRNRAAWHLSFEVNRNRFVWGFFKWMLGNVEIYANMFPNMGSSVWWITSLNFILIYAYRYYFLGIVTW